MMGHALVLARRGLGMCAPNPAVGCVIVDAGGRVAGSGTTAPGGRPHAETLALDMAGDAARGGTAWITLEPCSHHGKTPPCADALVRAGLARVVVAMRDPDSRVDGRGIARLEQAGIAVTGGVRADEAAFLNAGYVMARTNGRPLVTLKIATTLDGRIATRDGESRWITGPEARRRGHMLRASHDAIMIGTGTALADDPELGCRIAGLEDRSPVRVVVDARMEVALTSRLALSAGRLPLIFITGEERINEARYYAWTELGAQFLEAPADAGGRPDLAFSLAALTRDFGITRLLVEGGGRLAAALLAAGLVDRIHAFAAGDILGGDARAAIGPLGLENLAARHRFTRLWSRPCGPDTESLYARAQAD